MFNYGCAAGFLSMGFIGGVMWGISEKLKDAEELSVNWGKFKEFIQPFSWYKEVSKELEKFQEKLEDELDELE